MKVMVAQDDIDNGTACDCYLCPVARALQRLGLDAEVDDTDVLMIDKHLWTIEFPLPDPAREFIAKYDTGLPVEPFEFEMEFPPELEEAVRDGSIFNVRSEPFQWEATCESR